MNYTTLEESMNQVDRLQDIEAMSVYRAFEQIEDGRHKRGVRYRLALLLTLLVLGKLAGMTSLAGIAEWVRLRARAAQRGLAHQPPKLSLCGDL